MLYIATKSKEALEKLTNKNNCLLLKDIYISSDLSEIYIYLQDHIDDQNQFKIYEIVGTLSIANNEPIISLKEYTFDQIKKIILLQ